MTSRRRSTKATSDGTCTYSASRSASSSATSPIRRRSSAALLLSGVDSSFYVQSVSQTAAPEMEEYARMYPAGSRVFVAPDVAMEWLHQNPGKLTM